MKGAVDFSRNAFVVITGSSQGIGRTIAIEVAKLLNKNSIILLVARSETGLNETKSLILKENNDLNVFTKSFDLSTPDVNKFEQIIEEFLKKQSNNIELGIIFHNAGQVGILNATTELNNLQEWQNYFDLNFFSTILLNSAFVKVLRTATKNLIVVNITSLCGRKPFVNMSMYGSAKAARDLFFQVFATEEKDVLVLNYSPGPVDTNMVQDIVNNVKDKQLRDQFIDMRENKTILTPEQTVQKLIGILKSGDFESGDVIDYYNRI